MQGWWIYEVPNAQAAFDAVVALDLKFGHDAHVAIGFVAREDLFVRDYLFVYVLVSNPLNRDMSGIDDLLTRFGIPRDLTIDELLDEEGLHLMSTGAAATTLGYLVERFHGEIEVRWPERRGRHRPDHDAAPHPPVAVRSSRLIERIVAFLAGKRSIWP